MPTDKHVMYSIKCELIESELFITCDFPSCRKRAVWEFVFRRLGTPPGIARFFYFCPVHREKIEMVNYLVRGCIQDVHK